MPVQKSQETYWMHHVWEDKKGYTFPKGICPKVNVIAPLEFELTYYNSTVRRFYQYTTTRALDSTLNNLIVWFQ